MTKIDVLRRYFFPCFSTPTTTVAVPTATTKTRISTSLRDDLPKPKNSSDSHSNSDSTESITTKIVAAPPRPSKTMVIGTIFGNRRGHVWFCIQQDRLSVKPILLLEFSIPTIQLVKEMQSGLVRVALESDRSGSVRNSVPLRSIPSWTMYCNGKRTGFAARRKVSSENRLILKIMQSMTIGAGVIPAGLGSIRSEEIMYMRGNFEHVVGGPDSESFHLVNPDEGSGQELSVFLMRS